MLTKLSKDEIEILYWAFDKNKRFTELYENKNELIPYIWRAYADILVSLKDLSIHGIQEKLADIGSDHKLLPTLSELKVAKQLAEKSFEVELLYQITKERQQIGHPVWNLYRQEKQLQI
jgi:hypothetical protein